MEKNNKKPGLFKEAYVSDIHLNHLSNKDIDINLKSNEDIQKEIELQLHEQYAQNNNSYFGSIVVLLCTLFAVFAAFGYVYIHTEFYSSADFSVLTSIQNYSVDALLLTSLAALFIIVVCYHICAYQGCAQRKEQFIIDAIRSKYYGENHNEVYKLFPNDYNPWGKEKHQIFQGHYGLFMNILYWVAGIIIVMTALKIIAFLIVSQAESIPTLLYAEIAVSVAIVVVMGYLCYKFYDKQIQRYENIKKEYLNDKNKRVTQKQQEEYEKTSKELSELKDIILRQIFKNIFT